MVTISYSFYVWVPLLLYPTAGYNGAPRWRKGWPLSFVFSFLVWAGFMTAIILNKRR
jgi:ACS family pantothenate transporter-like MFS transporter